MALFSPTSQPGVTNKIPIPSYKIPISSFSLRERMAYKSERKRPLQQETRKLRIEHHFGGCSQFKQSLRSSKQVFSWEFGDFEGINRIEGV